MVDFKKGAVPLDAAVKTIDARVVPGVDSSTQVAPPPPEIPAPTPPPTPIDEEFEQFKKTALDWLGFLARQVHEGNCRALQVVYVNKHNIPLRGYVLRPFAALPVLAGMQMCLPEMQAAATEMVNSYLEDQKKLVEFQQAQPTEKSN